MKAGKLDRTITIQRATTTLSAAGTPSETWTSLIDLRAEIVDADATEQTRDHGASTETAITFLTRFVDGITVADRLVYESRSFDIKAVAEIGRRRGLEIRVLARGL